MNLNTIADRIRKNAEADAIRKVAERLYPIDAERATEETEAAYRSRERLRKIEDKLRDEVNDVRDKFDFDKEIYPETTSDLYLYEIIEAGFKAVNQAESKLISLIS